ncbi:MAG: hypothetical protein WCR58_03075 [Bacteroidales bacterium]|jgi:hypothetical protein|nr:hypothetical protein [Bacteroidales bacterium]MDD3702494.1 hypothetical protein [Bacteroidales bacterium]MDY0368455.1 hypothetical protein [Bacteroidales bacterium]
MINAVSIGSGQTAVFKDDRKLAVLSYPKKFSLQAYIRLDNAEEYEIRPTNFWKTRFEVLHQGKTIIDLQSRWYGGFRIELLRPGYRLNLVFKSISFWKFRYLLIDTNGRRMADARIKFRSLRVKRKLEIQIELIDSLKKHRDCMLLIALFVYLIRHALKQTAILVTSS